MTRGRDVRIPEHPIIPLLVDRWSPRAMSGEPIDERELFTLFEAARWAPSAFNAQPWRMLYARRDTPQWPTFFDLLSERNKLWCRQAAALVLFLSNTTNDQGAPSVTHSFDTGAAWENFALQATSDGLVVHGMQGFDYTRARADLNVPDLFRIEAMAAVGRPGRLEDLADTFHARETPSSRKPLTELVREGPFRD